MAPELKVYFLDQIQNILSQHMSMHASTAKSRSGFIVLYAGCPLMWSSKLQTSIALSTTEAEYVALSNSLREIIPMMKLISEMSEHGWGMPMVTPRIHCRVFEDNSGAL